MRRAGWQGLAQVQPPCYSSPMKCLSITERIVFDWPRSRFLTVLLAAMLVKTGIWHIPNLYYSLKIAQNPFAVAIADPGGQYLTTSWLAPVIARLLGATSEGPFLLVNLGFAVAFTTLFLSLTFARLAEREARIAIVIFAALPVSGTAYFWVGNDGLTLLLLLAVMALGDRALAAAVIGIALGMQHFEQAMVSLTLVTIAIFATERWYAGQVHSWRTGLAALAGVAAGKLALITIFHLSGMEVAGRGAWFLAYFGIQQEQFWLHTQVIIWSILGTGWLVALRYGDRGRTSIPFFICLLGILPLAAFVGDQTRVLAIVTFPLLYVFWLADRDFLASLTRKEVGGLFLIWLLVPWIWVWGGEPKWSVFPYGIAYAIAKFTPFYQLPPIDIGNWPFGLR
ncbi:hypothetical protein E8L99_02335 [Phreatobacter aquaticus]|uniref:Glycosyltransferase RgtA/B/C/D-like domain-containing protein n=1 Tax=Phreatobacter aquaticus TaxID=2570229 RepID=A0A4D7QK53_9HYPH|nr:hypothetical protein [Phreatobacter aquaticus]QCK84702.1 hypothetical protein E8L99_02335 [Phreatobacter aquaticus]